VRILQLVTFPLRGCGSGIYCDKISQSLHAARHAIKVICADHYPPRKPYPTHAVLFNNGVNNKYDVPFNFPCFTTHPLSPTTTFGNLSEEQRQLMVQTLRVKIRNQIARFKPDLAHVHHGWVMGALLAETKTPYVISLHGTEHYGFHQYPAYQSLALSAIRHARVLIALTDREKAGAIETYGVAENRVVVIPNGIDTRVFKPMAVDKRALLENYRVPAPRHDKPVVLFASKLAAHKGLDVLLRAAVIYSQSKEKPITLIAGDGNTRGAMEIMARGLQLERVYFLGNQNQNDMAALYNLADVCVLPSEFDYFPLVALEALACGTPVIASDVGGLPQIVIDGIGFRLPPGDRAAWAERIEFAIHARFKASVWKDARAHILAHYSLEQAVQRIVDVYARVLPTTARRHAFAATVRQS